MYAAYDGSDNMYPVAEINNVSVPKSSDRRDLQYQPSSATIGSATPVDSVYATMNDDRAQAHTRGNGRQDETRGGPQDSQGYQQLSQLQQIEQMREEPAIGTQQQPQPTLSPQQQLQLLAIAQKQQQQMTETFNSLGAGNNGGMTNTGPGFCDRMWRQRRDMNKLLMYAFIILVALAVHSTIQFYVSEFIQPELMTPWQQFGSRLIYPVGIILLLWVIRTFSARG